MSKQTEQTTVEQTTVEVTNRTRAGIAINFAKPVVVTVAGDQVESDSIMIPRTPKGEYAAETVTFSKADWEKAMTLNAVKGLVKSGQLEAR